MSTAFKGAGSGLIDHEAGLMAGCFDWMMFQSMSIVGNRIKAGNGVSEGSRRNFYHFMSMSISFKMVNSSGNVGHCGGGGQFG